MPGEVKLGEADYTEFWETLFMSSILCEISWKGLLTPSAFDLSLNNESRKAKIDHFIKWSIMRIFYEAEPSYSNSSEIIGQWMSVPHFKMIRANLRMWER